jgi:hypothetical protein
MFLVLHSKSVPFTFGLLSSHDNTLRYDRSWSEPSDYVNLNCGISSNYTLVI